MKNLIKTPTPTKNKHRPKTEKINSNNTTCQKKRRQKRASIQPKSQQKPSLLVDRNKAVSDSFSKRRRTNRTMIYAVPHFMNDVPAPSSLPLPHHIHPLPLYTSFQLDPISDIQEKLCSKLKIKS